MKKILAMLVAATMILGMVNIFAVAETTATGSVYYLNFKPEQAEQWEALAKVYTEQTGVPVTVVTAASGTYEDTLRSEIEKPEAPTLFQVNGPVGLKTWSDYCLDLSDTEVYKELKSDLGIEPPKDGTLTKWAKQGVLMLNTTLTVRAGQANSHKNLGWTTFTDHVIEKLNDHEKPIVFLLWGGNARSKARLITAPQHLVLEAAHPSPLSAYNGFFGCHHFSMCNDYLKSCGLTPIDWDLNTP